MAITGVVPALITPFTADGSAVDEEALGDLVEHCIAQGVDGLLACGGTGEFTALTAQERKLAFEVVIKQAAGRVPVVAQAGGLSTAEAIAHSKAADAAGASAIMLGVPCYEPLSEPQVLQYFSGVAAAVGAEIMYYDYPYATGFRLTPDFLRRLVDAVPAVRYVKDSSGSFAQLTALLFRFAEIGVFCGSDTLSGPACLAGAGLINGAANIAPGAFVTMNSAVARGHKDTAVDVWLRLLPLLSFLESKPFVSTVKNACRLAGRPAGPVRAPLVELSTDEVRELERLLDALEPLLSAPVPAAVQGQA